MIKKITEEMLYDENWDLEKSVCSKVCTNIFGDMCDYQQRLEESLVGCESPIEQLLAIELENITLTGIVSYNPFIDVISIEKQKEIKCGKKTYRVDFYIPVIYKNQDNIEFIVECDGHEFHQKTKEQVERDNDRMRSLQEQGYEVIRFSGTEICHRQRRCAMDVKKIILSKCKYNEGI